MNEVQESLDQNYSLWDFKGQAPFIDEWVFMKTPWPMLTIIAAYLLFIFKLGPTYMKGRQPYKLRKVLLYYNAFQVGFSLFLAYQGLTAIFELGLFESGCYKDIPEFLDRLTSGHYWYHIAKLTELLDTVFFVLRKKWNQISFLHVYHHFFMYVATWVSLKYETSYSLVFIGTINSVVHIIMYTYYGLSAFPRLKKYLWWKKYITKLQLIQFLLIVIHIICNSFISKCRASYMLLSLCCFNALLFLYLFTDFYVKSYKQKIKESQASKDKIVESKIQNESSKMKEKIR